MSDLPPSPDRLPDWEAFYGSYRKPGYVPGYEITSKLGGGAYGMVFRARKESIGKDYAIKFLKVEDDQVRQAVLHELDQVKYFAQIDHPNLVQIEDRGEIDGIPYLVMQFAGSETLRDRIPTDGRAVGEQQEQLMQLFLQACRGVMALHEHSLVHFDCKPGNVFLKGSVARVGDYGLSKLVTHSRGSLTMGRGTPYYMAPEILKRRGDQRSDIYSLGVMLYEILVGRLPFTGDSEWEVLRKHEKAQPEWPEHLSLAHRTALQRCLQKDPDARYQTVGELISALMPGSVASPPPPSLAMRSPPLPPAALRPPPLPRGASTPPPLPPAEQPVGGGTLQRDPLAVPPPLPRRHRRTSSKIVLLLLLVVAVFFVFMVKASSHTPYSRGSGAVASERAIVMQDQVSRSEQGLGGRLVTFVKRAQRTRCLAEQRVRQTRLRSLSFGEFGAPRDISEYVNMVEVLAEAPTFSVGHATKLARYGRPTFLAAIAMLQELDYEDAYDCLSAAHITELLAQMTGLGGLKLHAPGGDPTRADTCRFRANADAWRRLAGGFAMTEGDYRALIEAMGRGRANGG